MVNEGLAWCVEDFGEDDFIAGNGTRITQWPIWQEIPTPTTRPMTRLEVLEKVTTTPGMVTRYVVDDNNDDYWRPAQFSHYADGHSEEMEWAIVKDGEFSEPQRFEMTE